MKRAALVLTIITIVALTATLNVGNVHAAETLTVSPNPVVAGTALTVTGDGFVPGDAGILQLYLGSVHTTAFGPDCVGSTVGFPMTISVDGFGHFVVSGISTTGFSVGAYCAYAYDFDSSAQDSTAFAVTTTIIPEYPLGLTLLAIFMILAYGVIRRKTITKQK
jgi:hypothetical protein